MTFNPTPTDTSTPTPIPMGTVITPGDKTPKTMKGGPATTDSQSNPLASASVYTYDGDNETEGAKANTAITDATQTATKMSFIKGFVKILADVWDSVNHWLQVKVMNTVTVSGAVTTSGTVTEANSATINTSLGTLVTNTADLLADGDHLATIDTATAAAKTNLDTLVTNSTKTPAVGSALTPWSSQPTVTVAAAADTILKWGSGGATPFTHLSGQNNGTINFVYSIDADSTAGGTNVYVVAPGQAFFVDRAGSALHCHTASSVSFGGDTGITVEAFA